MSGMLPEIHRVVNGATSTTTSTAATLIAAPDIGKLCITSLQLGRTDTGVAPITVTLNDTVSSVFVLPASSASGVGANFVFDTPLVWAPLTKATLTPSSAVTTLFAAAQGFTVE